MRQVIYILLCGGVVFSRFCLVCLRLVFLCSVFCGCGEDAADGTVSSLHAHGWRRYVLECMACNNSGNATASSEACAHSLRNQISIQVNRVMC